MACADLIVLSKGDLLDAGRMAAARERIERHLGRAVKIVAVEQGRIEPQALLGLGMAVEEAIEGRRMLHDGMLDHEHDHFDSSCRRGLPAVAVPAGAQRTGAGGGGGGGGCSGSKGSRRSARALPMRLLVQAVRTRVSHHYDRAWGRGGAGDAAVVIGLKGFDRAAVAGILAAEVAIGWRCIFSTSPRRRWTT